MIRKRDREKEDGQVNGRWIARMLAFSLLLILPFSAFAEADNAAPKDGEESGQTGVNLGSIEITVGGVPLTEALGTAGGLFKDAMEENVGEAVNELNEIFGQFAEEMTGDLKEIEELLGSLMEETWILKIPAVSFDAVVAGSTYESALELYEAQLSGEAGDENRIAAGPAEDCSNSIVYIHDEEEALPAIREAVENGTFVQSEIIFGIEGFTGTYEISKVLFFSPSIEASAICSMTDLSDEGQFEAFSEYVTEHAVESYDAPIEYGDRMLTIIFMNEDEEAEWLTVVAREVPFMLE